VKNGELKLKNKYILIFLLSTFLAFGEEKESSQPRVVYPKRTELDFEGLRIEGEVRNPGDFYFRHRPPERFDSLIKKRENFHREMLRDAVMSR